MNLKHRFIYAALRPLVALFLLIKFNYRAERPRNLPENYIVLANHTTDFDPLFVAVGLRKQMYFVASEHIARWENAFKFIKFGFDPIMRYKGSLAASTVMEVLRRVRSGNRVCVFAEGARSWDGRTGPILPSTGKMIKSARCALVTYKLTGGYFSSPNWSEGNNRRGKIEGSVVNFYTAEALAAMSVDEINEIICRDLHEDAYARQAKLPVRYKGKRLAEGMENLLFICPNCGTYDSIATQGDAVSCTACGHSFTYDEFGALHGSQFANVRELSDWQLGALAEAHAEGRSFSAPNATLATVAKHISTTITSGTATVSPEAISCGDVSIPMSEITDLAMHGRHAVVFSTGKDYYELISNDSNMLKFHLMYLESKKVLSK